MTRLEHPHEWIGVFHGGRFAGLSSSPTSMTPMKMLSSPTPLMCVTARRIGKTLRSRRMAMNSVMRSSTVRLPEGGGGVHGGGGGGE